MSIYYTNKPKNKVSHDLLIDHTMITKNPNKNRAYEYQKKRHRYPRKKYKDNKKR